MTHLYMSDLEELNRNSDRHPSLKLLLHRCLRSQASSYSPCPRGAQERRAAPVTKDPGPSLPWGAHTGPLSEAVTASSSRPTDLGNIEEKVAISKR